MVGGKSNSRFFTKCYHEAAAFRPVGGAFGWAGTAGLRVSAGTHNAREACKIAEFPLLR
jgi:hypothetical protein